MQTFLPFPDFEESAYALDPRRLGKQRVENLQIMQALFGMNLITSVKVTTDEIGVPYKDSWNLVELPKSMWKVEPAKLGWQNHPAVKMWRGHEWTLLNYQKAICADWTENLAYKDTCFEKTLFLYFACYKGEDDTTPPPWLGDEKFHISHQSNLLRKDPQYYTKHFPGVPDNLPYVWPV